MVVTFARLHKSRGALNLSFLVVYMQYCPRVGSDFQQEYTPIE